MRFFEHALYFKEEESINTHCGMGSYSHGMHKTNLWAPSRTCATRGRAPICGTLNNAIRTQTMSFKISYHHATGTGGPIQYHGPSPCQVDPRPLFTTQSDTSLPHNGPVTVGQELEVPFKSTDSDHLSVPVPVHGLPKQYVLLYRAYEQPWLL